MPIYLDRHDTPEEITPEHVAEMHQADLKVQDEFGCRGFTYWFDNKRKSGFCLIEAPNKEALIKMHDHAHGAVPHHIIEVEENMVEAFLGRLVDPEKASDEALNIIDEPAFRTICFINIHATETGKEVNEKDSIDTIKERISEISSDFNGRIVKKTSSSILSSFKSVSKAVEFLIEINSKLKEDHALLNMALSCGIPVTEKEGIFEDSVSLAQRMADHVHGNLVISSEVYDLYMLENTHSLINKALVKVLDSIEQEFLNSLLDFMESNWDNPEFKVADFTKNLGLSKSQVYRKFMKITAKSPNTFIRDYRLNKALHLLKNGNNTISETAFETGFNSPSYFSKCFFERYGITPSSFLKTSSPHL
jgi:AraC-like DNA-binding protein